MLIVLDKFSKPHEKVQRILRLPDPLPPEYQWAKTRDGHPVTNMAWLTTIDECRQEIARDLAEGNGHIVLSPHMPISKEPQND